MNTRYVLFALLLSIGSAQAALIDRGGGLIYDTEQNITWRQDANIYGITATWQNLMNWAEGYSYFDSVRNVTWDDWRLPTTAQPDSSCDSQTSSSPPNGFGIGCSGSEMGHLFNVDGITAGSQGPFTNVQAAAYWSGTPFDGDDIQKWYFRLDSGFQQAAHKNFDFYAFAVRDGDVGAVPVPGAVWLFGSALALLGWLRSRT